VKHIVTVLIDDPEDRMSDSKVAAQLVLETIHSKGEPRAHPSFSYEVLAGPLMPTAG